MMSTKQIILFLIIFFFFSGCMVNTESNFTIKIIGSPNLRYSGSYMIVSATGESKSHSVEGVVPAEYNAKGWIISCSFQKQSDNGSLSVIIYRNGQLIEQSTTSAAYGVVTVALRGDSNFRETAKIIEEKSNKSIEPSKSKKEITFDPSRMSKEGYLDAKWGMNGQEVKELTGASLNSDKAYLEGEILNTKVSIVYQFVNDKLYQVAIPIKLDTINIDNYIEKYSEIEDILLKKYGKAQKKERSRNNPYIPFSTAISIGEGFYRTKWETSESLITLYLGGEITKIYFILIYESKKYKSLAKKEKEKKEKEKL